MHRSTNPVLSKMDTLRADHSGLDNRTMTVSGTITKAFFLIIIAAIAGMAVFSQASLGYTDKVMGIMTISLFAGFVTAMITSFVPKLAKFLTPIYAFCEGACLTGLSYMFEKQYQGIALQAIAGTMLCFMVMLVLYKANVIKATEKFRSTMITAMITIVVLYVINMIGMLFNMPIPFVSGSGPMSILFSGIVVFVASFSLILDFDFIEKGQANMLNKDMEWYGAFGLIVTLVWLYVEILNLLAKLRDN